jgi:hypothetical protein
VLAAIAAAFDDTGLTPWQRKKADAERHKASQTDKGHGRLEKRTLTTTAALNQGYLDWPHLGQCFQLVRQRTLHGQTTSQTSYGITSLTPDQADARQLLRLVRGHWSVESLFWVRDVTFGEDDCRARTGAAPRVLSGLRNIAISLLDHAGLTNKAAALRRHAAHPEEALALVKSDSG